MKIDRRKVKDSKSPAYLDAVGRINIYFDDGSVGICTGSLISEVPGNSSKVIQSATHCFENKNHSVDKITWEVTTKKGEFIKKILTLEKKDFYTDIAILTMDEKISFKKIKPFIVEMQLTPQTFEMMEYADQIIAAGYSADSEKGKNGEVLTYDDEIKYDYKSFDERNPIVDTVTFSGASGGPIIVRIDLTDDGISNPYDQMYIAGSLIGAANNAKSYYTNGKLKAHGSTNSYFRGLHSIAGEYIEKFNK